MLFTPLSHPQIIVPWAPLMSRTIMVMKVRYRTHHAETHSLVTVHEIAQVLASCSYGDAFPVTQLMQPALNAKVRFPVLAIGWCARLGCCYMLWT